MALTKVTYTDLVTIIWAQNLNDIQDAIIALEEWQSEAGADIPQILANIAPSFSNSTSYSAGDCVIVLNKLYQFTAAHPAGDWTGADAEEVNVTSLLKEAADSLSVEVDSVKAQALASYATDTASGAIASFPDGADDIPVKDLTVAIEPVQNLHGYANPWPAGSGDNLAEIVAESYGGTISNGLITTNEMTYSTNFNLARLVFGKVVPVTLDEIFYISFDVRVKSGSFGGFNGIQIVENAPPVYPGISTQVSKNEPSYSSVFQRVTVSVRATKSADVYGIYLQGKPSNAVVLEIANVMVTTQNSYVYSPYSNICPISGWTGAIIAQGSGMQEITSFQQGIFTNSGQTAGAMYAVRTGFIPVESNTEYAFKCDLDGVTLQFFSYATVTDNPQAIARASADGKEVRITTGENGLFVRASIALKDQTKGLTPADVDKAYLLTVTSAFSITFPTAAGTVYGGTLDVTTGKLTVDRAGVDMGTLTWEGRYTGLTNKTILSHLPSMLPHRQQRIVLAENYQYFGYVGATSQLSNPDNLAVGLRTYYTTDFAEYDNLIYAVLPISDIPAGLVVYPLATPIVYDLTPTEVTTLLAQNNIWADCGDSTVEYRADTKLYIDKKIAALAAAMN